MTAESIRLERGVRVATRPGRDHDEAGAHASLRRWARFWAVLEGPLAGLACLDPTVAAGVWCSRHSQGESDRA